MTVCRLLSNHLYSAALFACVSWVSAYGESPRKTLAREKIKKSRPTFFLIAVGVNQFSDPFFPKLKFAESDALGVAKKFGVSTHYQVKPDILLGENATLSAVKETMARIERSASPKDMVGFYFSGHGTLARLESGRIAKIGVLSNTLKNELGSTGLSHELIKSWLDRLRAKRRFAIIASCHSGEGKSRLSASLKDFIAEKKGDVGKFEAVSEGVVFASAASLGETAHESKKLRGDIYTHYLLESLSKGDRNSDGKVTLREAHDYSRAKTFSYSGGLQRPTLVVSEIGQADLDLFGKAREPGLPVLEGYGESFAGLRLGLSGKGGRRLLPGALVLEKGVNEVEVIGDNNKTIARYRVRLKQGETLQLSQLLDGPKIVVAPFIGIAKPLTEKLKKLTNNKNSSFLGLRADYRLLRILRAGFTYAAATKSSKSKVDLGLSSSLSQSEVGVFGLVDWSSAFRLNYFAEFGLSRSEWELEIADDQSIYQEARHSNAVRWSVGAGVAIDVGRNNRVFTALSYSAAKHDFGSWGDIDARSAQMLLGLEVGLGAKGIKL